MSHERWLYCLFFVCFHSDNDDQHLRVNPGSHRHPRASSMLGESVEAGRRSMAWSTDEDDERLLNLRSRQTRVENGVRPIQSGASASDHRWVVGEPRRGRENQRWRIAEAAATEVATVSEVERWIDWDPMYSVSNRDWDLDSTLSKLSALTDRCHVPRPRFRSCDRTGLSVWEPQIDVRHVEDEYFQRWFPVLSVSTAPVCRHATRRESSSRDVSLCVEDQ